MIHGYKKICFCFLTTFFTVGVFANDSIVFKPVVGGTEKQETLPSLSTSEQWSNWCGVRVEHPTRVDPTKSSIKSYYTITDGQRFAGVFELDNAKLSWRNNTLQSVVVDLEQTQSIGPLHIGMLDTIQKDSVLLVNSDQLDGFIESIDTTTGVSLQTTTPGTSANEQPQKQLTNIPIHRIVEIRLATKVKQPTGWRFWLTDGSVIDVDSWSNDINKCNLINPHLVPEIQGVKVFWSDVLSIAPNSKTITALANCPWRTTGNPALPSPRLSPPTIQPMVQPAAFDAIPLTLHGPGVFQFSTPQTKSTFSASLSLPGQLKNVIDCQITIECAGKVLWQKKVTSEFQTTPIQIPVDGNEITFRLDESKHGALGCAILITDAIFISDLCGTPPQPIHHPPSAPIKSDL